MNQLETIAALAASNGCTVLWQEPMFRHTTFKIGGPAELFLTVPTATALQALLPQIAEAKIPCQILGKGSNLLVNDAGIEGVVLLLSEEFALVKRKDTTITCGAAAPLSILCKAALDAELTGMEFAWGIPGSVGGALFMNAGAYGSEMKQVVVSCDYMTMDGVLHTASLAELDLSYRHSIFHQKQGVILSVTVALTKGEPKKIRAEMSDILERRKAKQPLEYPSAGSIFKRPKGYFAGTLIQECGLKGKQIGGAMVSPKHAGFIVNVGGATCQDVLDLIALIQETVQQKTGVRLECEVRPIGGVVSQ